MLTLRLRDLRWHILACVILLIAYAGLAFAYYISISSGKVEKSMKTLGVNATEEVKTESESKINMYFEMFIDDESDSMVYTSGDLDNSDKPFELFSTQDNTTITKAAWSQRLTGENTAYAFSPANNIETQSANSRNYDYYVYFAKPVDSSSAYYSTITTAGQFNDYGYLIVRMHAKTFFEFIERNTAFASVSASNYAEISYSNVSEISMTARTYISDYIGSAYKEDLESNGLVNNVYTIDGDSYVVTIEKSDIFGMVATFINIEDTYLGIAWVYQQAIIFYVAGVIFLGLMLGILILGCWRTSQLLRADRHALQKTEAIVIRVDLSGNVIFSNKTFKLLYGVTREVKIKDFIDVETNLPIMETMKKNKAFICEVPLDEIRDRVIYLQLTPLEISRSYYLMGTNVTIEYNESQRLQKLSGLNEITNCENEFILATKFEKIIKEDTAGLDVGFVEFNIHKFNDLIQVFGKTTYNQMLVEFLKLIRTHFEEMSVYHLDISKFMVIYPNTSIDEIAPRVEALLDDLKRPITIKANNIYLNCKVVCYDLKREAIDATLVNFDEENQITLQMIMDKLDLAYRNMGELSSKDYVVYEAAMDNIILATDEMERDIETGLIDREFQMWLQPQFDIVNNRVDGFEALIRWMNPKYKDKSPQIFIELAEQRGHMLDIGRFVITESFKLAKRLEPYGIHISVNVSPVQLMQVGFVQQLIDEFNRNQLKPGAIAVEVTETLLMGSFKTVAEKLRLLRDAGFHIHLDDFCTGYSSMLYLKDLPVDTIKIDKEFTKYITTNKFNENIVKTLCTLARDLDLDMVCEGVEDQDQADMIKKFGCRIIQGWLYGKAMPYEQAVEMLEKYNTGSNRRR